MASDGPWLEQRSIHLEKQQQQYVSNDTTQRTHGMGISVSLKYSPGPKAQNLIQAKLNSKVNLNLNNKYVTF